jgi:hypothetical protein
MTETNPLDCNKEAQTSPGYWKTKTSY